MSSSVTSVAIGIALTNGAHISSACAGMPLLPSGGDASKPTVPYLYSKKRNTPALAKIDDGKLPADLPNDDYTLKIQRQGDGPANYTEIAFTVTDAPAVVTPTPAPLPENTDPTPATPALPVVPWGAVASEVDAIAGITTAITRLKTDGAGMIRIWASNFGTLSTNNVAIIKAASAAGLKVILCVQPKDGSAENLGTPDFAGFVNKNTAILRLVWRVEVGNELNLNQYRPDDLGGNTTWYKLYVDRWLAPMSVELAKIGVKCMVTSVTYSDDITGYATDAAGLAAAGVAKWADCAAIHNYAYADPGGYSKRLTVANVGATVAAYSKAIGLPACVTEANLHKVVGTGDVFAEEYPDYLKALRLACVLGVCVYRAVPRPGNSQNSARPLFSGDGKSTTEAYAMTVKAFAKGA